MGDTSGSPVPPREVAHDGTEPEELRAAWRELNEVVEEIRLVPGYEDFMAPPTFDDVAAAATRPLCYISATESEGLALVVRGTSVEAVRLPELTAADVHLRVSAVLTSYKEFRTDSGAGLGPWVADLEAATRWAWDAIMEPVLDQVREEAAITLVPGGMLGLLPLHAAWTPDRTKPTGRAYAMDTTTISYAPNARSLTAARRIAARGQGRALLAIIDPQPLPAGYPEMPYTGLDAAIAIGAVPGTPRVLSGTAATLHAVRREFPASDVVHFACHGFADLENPLDSGLVLAAGEPLRVRDLLAMDVRMRVAVLSSCETSLPGTDLPDEVISLPTGLLQAGVAGVVAPLWAIPDMQTSVLMTEFYRGWDTPGWSPGEALRRAQMWLRDTTNAEKVEVWERALDDGSGWPPSEVADALLDRIMRSEPEQRDGAPINVWAAFSHVGV